jgi:hypothetical protein
MNPIESYLTQLRDIRSTGAAVAETSFYPALSNLFSEIGKGLRPKVRCVMPIADRGAGLPDGGFFAATQFQKAADAKPRPGALPERGVVEAPKSVLCPPKSPRNPPEIRPTSSTRSARA